MDIRKKDSCSLVLLIAWAGAIILIAKCISFAGAPTAGEVMAATYKLGHEITPSDAQLAIAGLEKLLVDCKDNNLAFRIKYRIGMIYFKARMNEAANSQFLHIANESGCPELIRVCSFNMIGQTFRMQGKNKEALDAFNQVANFAEQPLTDAKGKTVVPAFMKLCCSALLSRAEICRQQRNYAGSISEYDRLLRVLGQYEQGGLNEYIPLARDRISQLYLREGKIDKYMEIAETLSVDYPQYYRAGVIKFETGCVKFLRGVSKDYEFADGSFTAPSQLIAYFKDSKDKDSAKPVLDDLDRLCKVHSNTYGGILLNYHYAWLLDTLGEKDRAIEALAQLSSVNIKDVNSKVRLSAIAETVAEYAKIQRAIMLGEKGDYKKALEVVGSLCASQGQSHLSDLAKSVNEGILTLRREVPAGGNK